MPELSRQVVELVEAAATEAGESGEPPERATVTLQYSPRVSIVSGQVMNTVAERMQASLHENMGAKLVSDSTMLAEAEGRQIGAAATLALEYPVQVEVTEWNPLPDGVQCVSADVSIAHPDPGRVHRR